MTRLQTRGVWFTLLSPLPVIVAWIGAKAWLAGIAQSASNPNQNAMLLALIINVSALIVGAGLLGYGLECFRRAWKDRKQDDSD